MDDATFGLMMGFGGAVAEANAAADDWMRYARRVEANRDVWMNHAKKLEAEVDDLKDKLAVERAHSSGLKAVVDAFKAAHPDSPMLDESGAVFKSEDVAGAPKRRYHMMYEIAFDREARKHGIENPASRRYD